MTRVILFMIWAALAAGCAREPTVTPRTQANLSGYPPEFRQGYAEGCASATPNAARKRDDTRFKSDPNYAQGWQDGYDICRRQK